MAFDRNVKAKLYARAGLADYWIVNLVERRLERFRKPVGGQTEGQPSYSEATNFSTGEAISPLAAPDSQIAVADLFP